MSVAIRNCGIRMPRFVFNTVRRGTVCRRTTAYVRMCLSCRRAAYPRALSGNQHMLRLTNEALLEQVDRMRRLVEDLSKQDLPRETTEAIVQQIEADLRGLSEHLPPDAQER